jgi:hypothetical protein
MLMSMYEVGESAGAWKALGQVLHQDACQHGVEVLTPRCVVKHIESHLLCGTDDLRPRQVVGERDLPQFDHTWRRCTRGARHGDECVKRRLR